MSHFVYVMVAHIDKSAFFKIGISRTVGLRISSVQTGCPAQIEQVLYVDVTKPEVASEIERGFHGLLEPYHSYGEWFRFDLKNRKHKKAFAVASQLLLNRVLGNGWKWKVVEAHEFAALAREDDERDFQEAKQQTARHYEGIRAGMDRWRASKGLSAKFVVRPRLTLHK